MPERYRLSSAQSAIWFAQMLDPVSAAFNLAEYFDIHGHVDQKAFSMALGHVLHRTDALHLRIIPVPGEDGPQQYLARPDDWTLPFIDFSSEADPEAAALLWMRSDLGSRVQLDRDSLFHYALLQLAPDRFFWYARYHHLCMDGFGGALVARHLAEAYAAVLERRDPPVPVSGSCFDLLDEEDNYRQAHLARDREYWQGRVRGRPEVVTLSGRMPERSPTFIRCTSFLPRSFAEELTSLGNLHGASFAQVIEAAAGLYLHRFTGARDLMLGIPLTSRVGRKLRSVPVMLSNILPLRLDFGEVKTFGDLLRQTAKQKREMVRHQRYRAEDLRRDLSIHPADPDIYGMLVNVMPFEYGLTFAGCDTVGHNLSNGPVDEFAVAVYDRGDGLDVRIDFDANPLHYTHEELVAHQRRFMGLLRQTPRAELPIHDLSLLLPDESYTVVEKFNPSTRTVSEDTLPQLLERQVARTPDARALIFDGLSFTYAQINARSNRLAHHLVRMGIGPESLVGICLPRSVEMLFAILAVLKAGAAYVPLDPEYPVARLASMLGDAAPKCVITSSGLLSTLPTSAVPLAIDSAELREELHVASEENLSNAVRRSPLLPQHLAYVIYTSGSTGRPKGVMLEHRCASTFIAWAGSVFSSEEWAGVLASTSISFDLSVFELLATLSHGGTVVLAGSALDLRNLPARDQVRLINTVPSAAQTLLDSGSIPEGVRTINLAGEALPKALVQELYKKDHVDGVYNLYGPSEATTYSTFALCGRDARYEPTIGSPIWNTRAYVLDAYLQALPVGATGELYLAGAGLARGYLNLPGLTAERFVADLFGGVGSRMYRTGDLARWRPDGTIDFLGRADQQVKIRGFRIELGEIEAALLEDPMIHRAVVIGADDGASGKQLLAYLVPALGSGPNITTLRSSLAKRLPRHMIPAGFVMLDSLPLTPSGKVDRLALPAPSWREQSYTSPRTPEEELLCCVFSEVLSRARVGIHDDFFELGGHSLTAMGLLSRVRGATGVELSPGVLFDSPTVAQLAIRVGPLRNGVLQEERYSRPERLPLSDSQQRLWFIDQLEGNSTQYHIPEAIQLRGDLNVPAVHRAVNAIVERHESLRTRFLSIDDEPVQIVTARLALKIAVTDLSSLGATEQEERVRGALQLEWDEPFDLERGPLLRFRLLKLSPKEHVLLRTFHHIIADGWSEDIFHREFAALYEEFCGGAPATLPALPWQYADFVLWERGNLASARASADMEYWKHQLADMPESLELPRDRPRQRRQTFNGRMLQVTLGSEQPSVLRALGRRYRVTLYMTLLGAFSALLQRYTGQDDIVVGSPVANRQDRRLEELIGYFSNAVVMRSRIDPEMSFSGLLTQVRSTALDAYSHQHLPFEQLHDGAFSQRSLNRPPVFQVMFALQNTRYGVRPLKGLETEPSRSDEPRVRFDLELYACEVRESIELYWVYNRDLFDHWRIEQMSRHFICLLQAAVAGPDAPLHHLPMMSPEDRRQLLSEWNETAVAFPPSVCVHHLFERQAERTPTAVAVGLEDQQLTYSELDRRANQLAHCLRRLQVGPEQRVALCMERSLEMLVGLLGVLKTGGVFVPLDPVLPRERIAFLLRDSRADIVLTQPALRALLPSYAGIVIELDAQWSAIVSEEEVRPSVALSDKNLAYIIYTSGSTGQPKGVAVEHRSVCNQLLWAGDALSLTSADCVLQKASYSFDASILEIFLPLAWGARIAIAALPTPASRDELDLDYLIRLVLRKSVTYVDLAPSLLEALLEHPLIQQWTALRVMSSGAEVLRAELVKIFYQKLKAELWNTYGPTETTVQSTFTSCRTPLGTVSIGRPIANTRVYVLNERLDLVPVGVAGELYIGGAGVARGYWGRSRLTAERFVADPFATKLGERLYRSGDLVRWLPDGTLDFLGRADQQVKLRGLRIEPGEIEATLKTHPSVDDALVSLQERGDDAQLVAYVVSGQAETHESLALGGELQMHLRHTLPEYMIPAAVVVLESWPLSPSGKIDRRALPQPLQKAADHSSPRSPREEILCSLFADILGVERVGTQDNFFELGGHSLLAARLVSRVRAALGMELKIRTLFESPSVAQLANRLKESSWHTPVTSRPRPRRMPLSYAQQRLWFLYRLEGPSATYNISLAVRLEGDLSVDALRQALEEVVARHETLRTIFPEHDGIPYQRVLSPQEAQLRFSLDAIDEPELSSRLSVAMAAKMELDREVPLQVWLFRLSERRHTLLLVLHHIAGDGWSIEPLKRDVERAYQARIEEKPLEFKPLSVQYADYTLWQRELLGTEDEPDSVMTTQLRFWRKALEGAPEELNLPVDRVRPARVSYRGGVAPVEIEPELHRRLGVLARRSGATLFMVLQAGLAVLLSRLGAGTDILIGTAIAGRDEDQFDELVGFFVNTLVLRIDLSGDPNFVELVQRTRTFALEAYENREIPFERLVDALHPTRSQSRHPVFQVMLTLQNGVQRGLELPGLAVEVHPVFESFAKFDLLFELQEGMASAASAGEPLGIRGKLVYSVDLFNGSTAEVLAATLVRLLTAAVATPQEKLSKLPLLSSQERQSLLYEFNAQPEEAFLVSSLPGATLTQLFEAQVACAPHAFALTFERQHLTYAELNERANRLAHVLVAQGVRLGELVGIMLERSVEMVVAMLGVLKAGAGYLPLDPEYPQARLEQTLREALPELVITTEALRGKLPPHVGVLALDVPATGGDSISGGNPARTASPEHPAYVIYTSGSTGKPKGVVVTHANVTRLFAATERWFHFRGSDVWALFHSYAFDVAVWEMWGALLHGGRLVVVPKAITRSPGEFLGLLVEERVTVLNQTPWAFYQLMQAEEEHQELRRELALRTIVFAGEALELRRLRQWYGRHPEGAPELVNMYGITETTVHVSHLRLTKEMVEAESGSLIGGNIPDLQIYVLDDHLEPVAMGVVGELYVAGAGLAWGYLKQPGMTGERFVACPFYSEPGARMYRSGDLARWYAKGVLEYCGRADQQVKVRGFRIELSEIELALRSLPDVAEAVVIVKEREGEPAAKQLIGYVVPTRGATLEAAALHRGLSQRLPEYMVPSAFAVLSAMPLTTNGKLDRRALPPPGRSSTRTRLPRTSGEETLCMLFEELLAVAPVGVDDNFFHLGGDSILSIQLVSRARRKGLLLAPRDIFQHQTPGALALAARSAAPAERAPDVFDEDGLVLPTPIMRLLMERGGSFQHFHQSMVLQTPSDLNESDLVILLQTMLDTHAALRLKMAPDHTLHIPPRGATAAGDYLSVSTESRAVDGGREFREALGRLDPEAGKMFQAIWYPQSRCLQLMVHHLAIDGVSWRILLSDLAAAWEAMARREAPVLEPIVVSFRGWGRYLSERADAPALQSELPFWERTLAAASHLLPGVILDPARDTISNSANLRIAVPISVTCDLLTSVSAAFHAQINEVLLGTLAVALLIWRRDYLSDPMGQNGASILLDVEGHGREPGKSGLDVSRTVGWFTSLFPVVLDLSGVNLDDALTGGAAMGRALKLTKDHIRRIPERGMGFGLLRYMDVQAGERLSAFSPAQVAFNYLGRFAAPSAADWLPIGEDAGFSGGADPEMPLFHLLEIEALAVDGPGGPKLTANICWAQDHLSEFAVRRFAALWGSALESLTQHAKHEGSGGHSPSDFPLVALSLDQLESLEDACSCSVPADILPLSPLQQGMMFHSQYSVTADPYMVQARITFTGELQPERLRRAVEALLDRYPNLRVSVFHEGLDQPVQVVPRNAEVPWREIDLSATDSESQRSLCEEIYSGESAERFVFAVGPLMRFALVRLACERHLLVFTHHHLLLDGWSLALFIGEMLEWYGGYSAGELLPHVHPYSDFLAWLAAQDHSEALGAWRGYLAGVEEATILAPAMRGERESGTPVTWRCDIPRELTGALRSLARERGLTMNTVLQGLWAMFLAHMSDRSDVLFGITVSGRPPQLTGSERMIGLLINTVPLRVELHSGERFSDMLAKIQASQAQMLGAQYLGLNEILRAVKFDRLFDTIFVFENYPMDSSLSNGSFAGLRIASAEIKDSAHYPLALMIVPGEQLRFRLDYDPSLFSQKDVERMASRFVRLAESAANHPDVPWHQLSLLSTAERHTLLEEFNPPAQPIPNKRVEAMFEDQVARAPRANAVIYEKNALTYEALNERANQLAHYLIYHGVGPESLVGIALNRSLEMVIAVLATWKAGAAYLPLDPEYPRARLEHMMVDAAPVMILSSKILSKQLPEDTPAKMVCLDAPDVQAVLEQKPAHNPIAAERTVPLLPQHPAYVIYTSGSTGMPKAVVVTHLGIPSLLVSQVERLKVTSDSRILQFASLNFDASFWEMVMAFGTGATLVLAGEERFGDSLWEEFVSQQVTHALLPLPVLATLAGHGALPIRCLTSAGEALSGEEVARWLPRLRPGCQMINAYGPTETTVCATISDALDGSANPPIGRPIANTQAYVLTGSLELAPMGVAGELYIAGAGLSRGYLHQSALTSQRFVADPLGVNPGGRMYRTGDRVRWREDGTLEFLGRLDQQIKLRGFRIELGEIEAALRSLPEVAEAVVLMEEGGCEPAPKQIVGYIVPTRGAAVSTVGLRRSLAQRLPMHMIPAALLIMDQFPQTPSGKVDRRSLPNILKETQSFSEPQTHEELELCSMFAEVLGRERVGVEDGFLSLGGDSLMAMRLAGRVRARFQLDLAIRDFYAASTIRELAAKVQAIGITVGALAGYAAAGEGRFEQEEI